MGKVAEDVYYVTRDGSEVIGLNQLMQVPPQLSEIELEAINVMCARSEHMMECLFTNDPMPPVRSSGAGRSLDGLPHGMYYVGPDGAIWLISLPGHRPDLEGAAMDYAIATVSTGGRNLRRLREAL